MNYMKQLCEMLFNQMGMFAIVMGDEIIRHLALQVRRADNSLILVVNRAFSIVKQKENTGRGCIMIQRSVSLNYLSINPCYTPQDVFSYRPLHKPNAPLTHLLCSSLYKLSPTHMQCKIL
jgi:hypothetical protein